VKKMFFFFLIELDKFFFFGKLKDKGKKKG